MINESKGHKLGAMRKGSPENERRRFLVTTWQEGDWRVAQALEVEIASQGETEQEALDNLKEALELHFEAPTATLVPRIHILEINAAA
jgi:predicted RNase H-like HicB family nuclease